MSKKIILIFDYYDSGFDKLKENDHFREVIL